MAASSSFVSNQIEDVLKSTFSISKEIELTCTVSEWQQDKYILDVQSESFSRKFALVKVTDNAVLHHPSSPSLISVQFAIENSRNELFQAFDEETMRNLQPAQKNNVQHLKTVLKSLAETQAITLFESNAVDELKILGTVCQGPEFAGLQNTQVKEALQGLQAKLDQLLKSDLLARSIWSPGVTNAYVRGNEGVFLDIAPKKTLPPTYDALMYIFSLSNALFRQKHFEALLSHYYKVLSNSLEAAGKETPKQLHWEEQVAILLPLAKIQLLSNLGRHKDSEEFAEILENFINYLKCPIINQEDVNEVLKNYLDSTDYVLLGYQLVPLVETNGHLGEYYHLDIKVTSIDRNAEQQISLFAKLLATDTELMKIIIESGPGRKEDFFYTTLYPVFLEHGLHALLDYAPKCYLSRNVSLLVLDDLSTMGYTSLTPNTLLEYQAVRKVVAKLANFHCSSLILEEILSKKAGHSVRMNEHYDEFLKDIILDPENGMMKGMLSRNIVALQHLATKCPDLTKKLGWNDEELNRALSNAFDQVYTVHNHDEYRKLINHGDMYIGNYLLKLNEAKSAEDVKLIDFQLLSYRPPAFELLFSIVSSTSKQVREQYLDTLIQEYYDKVSSNLEAFGLDAEDVFPKEQFDKSIKGAKLPATMMAFCYGNVIHIDPDVRVEFMHDNEKSKYYFENHRDELIDMFWDNQHYQSVMRGLFADLLDIIQENGV